MRLVVRVPDRPGSLAKLTGALAELGANVMEIYHNRAVSKLGLGEAEVEVTLETRGRRTSRSSRARSRSAAGR